MYHRITCHTLCRLHLHPSIAAAAAAAAVKTTPHRAFAARRRSRAAAAPAAAVVVEASPPPPQKPRPQQQAPPTINHNNNNTSTLNDNNNDDDTPPQTVTRVASHYRSVIPFKAQFISERVTATNRAKRVTQPKSSTQRRTPSSKPVSHLVAGITNIPHPKKKSTGGEDAWVVKTCSSSSSSSDSQEQRSDTSTQAAGLNGSSNSSSDERNPTGQLSVLAVFDGVGSWSVDKDVNVGLFSKALATATEYAVEKQEIALTPATLLDHAWQHVCERKMVGGSTACILTHRHKSTQVQCANLGDSGFIVLRPSVPTTDEQQSKLNIIFHSTFQWHYFNCPLQLGINIDGRTDQFDLPTSADVFSVRIQTGDIIVLSTDGLFDNLEEDECIALLERGWRDGLSSAELSATLAERAFEVSWDRNAETPFAVMAREENILWKGGRPDDITVVVAQVV